MRMKRASHSSTYEWNPSANVLRRFVHHPNVLLTPFSHENGPQFSEPRT